MGCRGQVVLPNFRAHATTEAGTGHWQVLPATAQVSRRIITGAVL